MAKSNAGSLTALLACSTVTLGISLFYWRKRSRRGLAAPADRNEKDGADAAGSSRTLEASTTSFAPVEEIEWSKPSDDVEEIGKFKRRVLSRNVITVVHGSVTGTCAKFAAKIHADLEKQVGSTGSQERVVQLATTEDFDWWDELLNDEDEEEKKSFRGPQGAIPVLILLVPTYTGGTWPPNSEVLESALQEVQNDWRISKNPLKGKLQVAIFGMGSSEYNQGDTSNMGQPAKEAVRSFQKLGAKCLCRVHVGDDAVGDHADKTFDAWREAVMKHFTKESSDSCGCGSQKKKSSAASGCCQSESPENNTSTSPTDDDYYSDEDEDDEGEPEVVDLEDMGDAVLASQETNSSEPREMVTPSQAAALTKEGYKLIGTHSAVKLCRWTKHQLRGRGGCYKHTFYGITSYQCMEATPSLACANKCVFCWRHHKNPVGKEWRWKTDDPNFIVEEAVKAHVKLIREARGIPGVRMDRWQEALTVKHCALSLVGEPIMYPRIDEFVADLHRRKISTFLVTNGQHPAAIESLRPITQLYVSVDAPTQESLIEIDRPLFQDAWDRLKESLVSLKAKGQRTVARLTVVKGWNSDEIEGYAKLIALGKVSLVEVKGVTFCGKSDASNLNMSNSPWHHEVVALTRTLKEEIDKIRSRSGPDIPPEYDLACEHKHSCSVLLARVDQFTVNDPISGERKWHTWIDYDKFHILSAQHAADPSFTFGVRDYIAETPQWALFGADEEGFDPTDKRHRKKQKHPKYTAFDENGIPTYDDENKAIPEEERERLQQMMKTRISEIGAGTTVTALKGGEKEVTDASLMFRGLVVAK